MEKLSREWYENVYHKKLPAFSDYLASAEKRGYKARFFDVAESARPFVRADGDALEIAAHCGKTVAYLHECWPEMTIDAFDFSEPVVKYLKKNVGGITREIWLGNVDRIDSPDATYDLVTCIDVIEHLDDAAYVGMICEISRVLKPLGRAIVFGSMAEHGTHNHKRNAETIIRDFCGPLRVTKMLAHRHILFRKPMFGG